MPRPAPRPSWSATALVVGALVLALAGCADDEPAPATGRAASTPSDTPGEAPPRSSPAPTDDPSTYVALGDSYTAAPGLPRTDTSDGCGRSSRNYPHLVARAEGLDLVDRSCSGATTDDVRDEQLTALDAGTDLVTVGIGGNDLGLFVQALGLCARVAASDPTGAPCTEAGGQDLVDRTLPRIRTRVDALLDAVLAAAPSARVVVVGYPRLLPSTGSCPDLVPLAAGDYPLVSQVDAGLSDVLSGAARRHDAAYADVGAASVGRDICSPRPWVNGQQTAADGTIPFHPLAAGQRGVARVVQALL